MLGWKQDRWEKHEKPQICEWYRSNGRSEEELKNFLMRVNDKSEKVDLKLNIKKKT